MLDVLSLAHYVDEADAAFDELANRDGCGWIFLLGHSEGSIHASSAAIAKQADPRFGGFDQPVRAFALDPRHGDRADPGDPHQGWQRRSGRG